MAFAPISRGSALPYPPATGRLSNDAAGFASCYGPHRRSPLQGFYAGLRPGPFPDRTASLLPGLLAATRTGLSPAGDDELTNSKIPLLRHSVTSRSPGRTKKAQCRNLAARECPDFGPTPLGAIRLGSVK